MFIERVTKEEMLSFLYSMYPKEKFKITNLSISKKHSEIYVSIDNIKSMWDYSFNLRFKDFSSSDDDVEWINFLYKKFGEEYKEAYLANCALIFDEVK